MTILIPRRMQLTASQYFFSFQSYNGLKMSASFAGEKTNTFVQQNSLLHMIRSQFCESLNDPFIIKYKSDLIIILRMHGQT